MTKQFIRKNIKQDRITTRGMKWRLIKDGKHYIAYGNKKDVVDFIFNLINKN
ncbi:MAG: hypothetical protein WC280_02480 [Patescibacteria group bacterium]